MKRIALSIGLVGLLCLTSTGALHGQQQTPTISAPAVLRINGVLETAPGVPRTGTVVVVASLYNTPQDAASLWSEAHTVTLDASGRYSIIIGSLTDGGLPADYFKSTSARYLGIGVQGEVEQPRTLIYAVPYAVKAQDADTLGGRTAADFVLNENLGSSVKTALRTDSGTGAVATAVDGGPITNATTTTDKLIVTAGGTPSDVGAIQLRQATNTSSGGLFFQDSTLSTNIRIFADATNGYIYNGSTGVGSLVFNAGGGSVGIGTTSPVSIFDVAIPNGKTDTNARTVALLGRSSDSSYSALALYQTGAATAAARNWHFQTTDGGSAAAGTIAFQANGGKVGIGTTSPSYLLDVAGVINTTGKLIVSGNGAPSDIGLIQLRQATNTSSSGLFFQDSTASTNVRIWADANNAYIYTGSTGSGKLVLNAGGGVVGIGTSTPSTSYALDVVGSINLSGNINAKYQDVAEWVEAPLPLEAGTVVIVDPTAPNRVIASTKPYDTRIAGAVSAMPGMILGEKADNKEMVAQGGRVRIKVDAKYGQIKIGDLLVTSATPGHAMVSKPVKVGGTWMHRPGTILGRALETWTNGKGEILVLLGSQ